MKPFYKFYLLCIVLGSYTFNAQTSAYHSITLYTDPLNYTVNAAAFDTTYTRELIITMADTNSFQSLKATLSVETINGWQTTQTVTHSKPLVSTACNTSLCIYRKDKLTWVLLLGRFPLSTKHNIELQFISLTPTENTSWSVEF